MSETTETLATAEISFEDLVEQYPHIHLGLYGLPGSGKDAIFNLLFKTNNQMQKMLGERPFDVVKRLSFADRVREIASWITGEEYQDYMHHPAKDQPVVYKGEEKSFSRRDFMVDLFKYFEKKFGTQWSIDKVHGDLELTVKEMIASKEWEVSSPAELEKAILASKPILFISTDVRTEEQYGYITSKPNSVMIKVVNKSQKKGKKKKLEILLSSKPFDLEINLDDYIVAENGRLSFNLDASSKLLNLLVEIVNKKKNK